MRQTKIWSRGEDYDGKNQECPQKKFRSLVPFEEIGSGENRASANAASDWEANDITD
jgi:hypothetical protein